MDIRASETTASRRPGCRSAIARRTEGEGFKIAMSSPHLAARIRHPLCPGRRHRPARRLQSPPPTAPSRAIGGPMAQEQAIEFMLGRHGNWPQARSPALLHPRAHHGKQRPTRQQRGQHSAKLLRLSTGHEEHLGSLVQIPWRLWLRQGIPGTELFPRRQDHPKSTKAPPRSERIVIAARPAEGL